MKSSPIEAFFNGAFDLLLASFTASTMLSDASKGASRETAARELLRTLVPPVARIESGDIIDAFGHQTGQLDGVVVDHRAPTLKLAGLGPALILAEGALAVLEVKSSLPGQATQVLETYQRASVVKPSVTPRKSRSPELRRLFDARAVDDQAIPFIVVAGRGWKSEKSIKAFCERLKGAVPKPTGQVERPHVLMVTLDPPCAAGFGPGDIQCATYFREERGYTIATVWRWVVRQARKHSGHTLRNLPLEKYFEGIPDAVPRESETGAH